MDVKQAELPKPPYSITECGVPVQQGLGPLVVKYSLPEATAQALTAHAQSLEEKSDSPVLLGGKPS